MRPSRFPSLTGSNNGDAERPREIVLLEDKELMRKYSLEDQAYEGRQPRANEWGSLNKAAQRGFDYIARSPTFTTTAPSHVMSDTTGNEFAYPPHGYHAHNTPHAPSVQKPSLTSMDTVPMSHGALRPGGAVRLFSRQYSGMMLNWFIIGFFNTSVQAMAYPLLVGYLRYTDVQLNAALALLKLPLLFKFPAGFLTDCIPINRQRRKPYILAGWLLTTLFMISMTFIDDPIAFHGAVGEVNTSALSQGTRYVIPLMIGAFAQLIVTGALEGMMVECAQREGEFVRGRTQTITVMLRVVGEAIGGLSIALSLNSKDYGGGFAAAVPLKVVFGFHALLAAVGFLLSYFFLFEEKVAITTQRFSTQMRRIWNIMQQPTTWQITIFGFLVKAGTLYEVQEYRRIYLVWLGPADSLTLNIIDAVASTGMLIAAWLFMRYFLNSNWRKIMVYTVAMGLAYMIPVDTITVFHVWRNLILYMTRGHFSAFTDSWLVILRTILIVEVAEPGYEAVTFGIITTVNNLAVMIVSMAKNLVAAGFSAHVSDLSIDDSAVKWHMMYQFFFKYGLRIVMVVLALPLLPRQKRHLKERKVQGNQTILIPIAIAVVFTALFFVSVTSNMLALFPSTGCLIIAGGTGCE